MGGDNKNGADKAPSLDKLLKAGMLAKAKLYQNLLNKIKEGVTLKPSELRAFRALEIELEGAADVEKPDSFQSMSEAAAYAKVSKTTIKYHADRGRIQINKDGSIPRQSLEAWMATRGKGKGGDRRKKDEDGPAAGVVASEKDQAELRYKLAKAQREELIVDQLKGNMAPWEEVEKEWAARVAVVTDGLKVLTDRLPPLLEGKTRSEMTEIIRDEIRALRDAYARDGKYCPSVA